MQLSHVVIDQARRADVEKSVGGSVVTDGQRKRDEVEDCDLGRVSKSAEPGWSGCLIFRKKLNHACRIKSPGTNHLKNGEGERQFHQRSDRKNGVGLNPDLSAGVEVSNKKSPAQSGSFKLIFCVGEDLLDMSHMLRPPRARAMGRAHPSSNSASRSPVLLSRA